jgi:hypothetical protein
MKNPNLGIVYSPSNVEKCYLIKKNTGISVKTSNMMEWDHKARTTKDIVFIPEELIKRDGQNLIFKIFDASGKEWFLKINTIV